MTHPAKPIIGPPPPPTPSIRFLVELDNTWSACRLYGPDHPAFARRAEAAVAALTAPFRLSIDSTGFHAEQAPLPGDELRPLARRLRAMGLVGIEAHPPLTTGHIASLILALDDFDRRHATGQPVADRIAAATDQRIKATPLHVGKLRFVSGTARAADPAAAHAASILTDLFFDRLGSARGSAAPSAGDGDWNDASADPATLARSFENAMRDGGAGSAADWNVVVEAWNQGLLSIEAPSQAPTSSASPDDIATRLHEVAAFLRSLSPLLCQRLLSGTVNHHATPAAVALALIERLPLGIVLGALSEVDRSSAAPSAAAVAVLRKIAANVTPDHAPVETAPRDNAQLAEVAATLRQLLGADQEDKFVPADYFNRRQELSADALAPPVHAAAAAVRALAIPSEQETSLHAAALAFALLESPDTAPIHLTSGLEFLRHHIGDWVRGGQFALAEQGLEVAQRLRETHADPEVTDAAGTLLADALDVDVLMEGSRNSADPQRAIADIVKLLGQNDGAALVSILSSRQLPRPAAADSDHAGGGTNVVLEAVRQYLPIAPDGWILRLFGAGQTEVPAGLAGILATMPDDAVFGIIGMILPRAASTARRALAHIAFRRKGPWPVPLIERLLRDAEPAMRRLAVMRCVRDADLPTAAAFLRDASDSDPYAPDVAVGLSDLLHPHRRHPDVRSAYRKWFWSRRRWAGFFSFSVSLDHGRRVAA